jgi:GNAT acetyltransferase-like protein
VIRPVEGQRRRAEEAIALREADRLYRYVIEDGGAVAAVLEEAFGPLGLHRVVAGTLVDNHASQRVLARNAFELIGLAREAGRIGGAWRDQLLFQRLADEPCG